MKFYKNKEQNSSFIFNGLIIFSLQEKVVLM